MSVNLVLKTTDITPSNTTSDYYNNVISTSIGTVSNYRTSFVWKNINMKILLGDLFEKYERFGIALIYTSGSQTGSATDINEDLRNLQVKLSGLPLTTSYDQKKGINSNVVTCSTILIPYVSLNVWESKNNIPQYFTFTKQNICDISIDLHTILTDTSPVVSSVDKMIGHCLFSFNIIGIDEFGVPDVMENRLTMKTFGYNK